jgi:hypothetical protein
VRCPNALHPSLRFEQKSITLPDQPRGGLHGTFISSKHGSLPPDNRTYSNDSPMTQCHHQGTSYCLACAVTLFPLTWSKGVLVSITAEEFAEKLGRAQVKDAYAVIKDSSHYRCWRPSSKGLSWITFAFY